MYIPYRIRVCALVMLFVYYWPNYLNERFVSFELHFLSLRFQLLIINSFIFVTLKTIHEPHSKFICRENKEQQIKTTTVNCFILIPDWEESYCIPRLGIFYMYLKWWNVEKYFKNFYVATIILSKHILVHWLNKLRLIHMCNVEL